MPRRSTPRSGLTGLIPRSRSMPRVSPDSPEEVQARADRVAAALYELYADLQYFIASPVEHRELLRRSVDWPDLGHITSLARALAEEERFVEWARFNRYEKAA